MNIQRTVFALILAVSAVTYGAEPQVFFGLLHGHTSFSDGSGDPDEAFEMAREAGLDFMAITEHNHRQAAGDDGVFLTPELYGQLIQSAKEHTVTDKFVAIWGQEFSTISSGNHVNIFFADRICDVGNGDFKKLYEEWLPDHAEVPFIQFNHPNVSKDQNPNTKKKERNNDYGIDDYDQDFAQLVQAAGGRTALIELIIGPAFSEATDKPHHNGSHERDYRFYLNQGFRLAPSVGQDNHNKTWGKATHARMGVWAEKLTAAALIDAIRDRRCYASEDENLTLSFTVDGQWMGSVIGPNPSGNAQIVVKLQDEDEPDATYRVKLFYDDAIGGDEAKVIEDQSLSAGELEATFVHSPVVGGYYFVKVTQDGDDHRDDAWSAPVWIGAVEFAAELAAANTDDPQRSEIDWTEAENYVGQEATVSGQLIRSYNHQNKAVFFNFDEDYENTLTLIILRSDFEQFGGLTGVAELQRRLVNKVVRVKGPISLYRNERVQLRLTEPGQILAVTESAPFADDE